MQARPPINPYRILNNFRLQTYIGEEEKNAKEFIKISDEQKLEISSKQYIDLALISAELGDWTKVIEHANTAKKLEEKQKSKDSDEIIAAALYVQAVYFREKEKKLDQAKDLFNQAKSLTKSAWLLSNILRNEALNDVIKGSNTQLSVENRIKAWHDATALFKEGCRVVENAIIQGQPELGGSLPALYNYKALSLVRGALLQPGGGSQQELVEGLQLFEQATELYQQKFLELKIDKSEQPKSNDFQSHQLHRGMILFELAEKDYVVYEEKQDEAQQTRANQQRYQTALQLFIGCYEGRKANKVDAQRMADVALWKARTYMALGSFAEAESSFDEALQHYTDANPKSGQDSSKMLEVKEYKNKLLKKLQAQHIRLQNQVADLQNQTKLLKDWQEKILPVLLIIGRSKERWHVAPDRKANAQKLIDTINANPLAEEKQLNQFIDQAEQQALQEDRDTKAQSCCPPLFKRNFFTPSRYIRDLSEARKQVGMVFKK